MEEPCVWKRRTNSIIKPENTHNKTIKKPHWGIKITENCGQLVNIKPFVWTTAMGLSQNGREATKNEAGLGGGHPKSPKKLLIVSEKKRVSDKIPVRTMRQNQKIMSVNQTAGQIKLLEIWKAKNIEEDYPLKIEFQKTVREGTTM